MRGPATSPNSSPAIDNTVQYALAPRDRPDLPRLDRTTGSAPRPSTTSGDRADHSDDGADWDRAVWERTNLEAVFLTNDFDDPLEGWDTSRYIPCLRTDDLVLKLHEPSTRERLGKATNVDVQDFAGLKLAIGALFDYFVEHGARACAISLPPDFSPGEPIPKRAVTPVRRALHGMDLRPDEHAEVRRAVFWMLAEFCDDFRLPFDLMIGPIRGVYPAGVAGRSRPLRPPGEPPRLSGAVQPAARA